VEAIKTPEHAATFAESSIQAAVAAANAQPSQNPDSLDTQADMEAFLAEMQKLPLHGDLTAPNANPDSALVPLSPAVPDTTNDAALFDEWFHPSLLDTPAVSELVPEVVVAPAPDSTSNGTSRTPDLVASLNQSPESAIGPAELADGTKNPAATLVADVSARRTYEQLQVQIQWDDQISRSMRQWGVMDPIDAPFYHDPTSFKYDGPPPPTQNFQIESITSTVTS